MANPLRDLLFGPSPDRDLLHGLEPKRTFADVILPPATRRSLDHALLQIRKHDVIFGDWGLGERHDTGLGLAFNFAGPPGTGKTICAEAIAHALSKRLLVVRYAELESQWAGATSKNVAAVFAAAAEEDAVLFFDEADAIATRRFTSVDQGYQREANAVVNVLLREVEAFPGVVIFATNLAANFDPAFERRIRTHILFEMPGAEEREKIWKAQIHARKTPLGDDVDFRALAAAYAVSGGDIKNAVLKAAQAAIAEPGPDAEKRIEQRHFQAAIAEVVAAKRVMDQSLFGEGAGGGMFGPLAGLAGAAGGSSAFDRDELEDRFSALAARLVEVEDAVAPVAQRSTQIDAAHADLGRRLDAFQAALSDGRAEEAEAMRAFEKAWSRRLQPLFWVSGAALVASLLSLGLHVL